MLLSYNNFVCVGHFFVIIYFHGSPFFSYFFVIREYSCADRARNTFTYGQSRRFEEWRGKLWAVAVITSYRIIFLFLLIFPRRWFWHTPGLGRGTRDYRILWNKDGRRNKVCVEEEGGPTEFGSSFGYYIYPRLLLHNLQCKILLYCSLVFYAFKKFFGFKA